MKKVFAIVLMHLCFLTSCATNRKVEPVISEKKPETEVGEKPVAKKPTTGWIDDNTYTVMANGPDLEKAKDAARHRIQKEVVNVRVSNMSPYTDITKISREFEKTLCEGRVSAGRTWEARWKFISR
jgi:transketolase